MEQIKDIFKTQIDLDLVNWLDLEKVSERGNMDDSGENNSEINIMKLFPIIWENLIHLPRLFNYSS